MKATLGLELFGDDVRQYMRLWRNALNDMISGLGDVTIGHFPPSCWVAEITGPDPRYKWARSFLRGKKDYSKANSKGSRGVFAWYTLESGRVYEVKEKTSWKNSRRYFCRVTEEGEIVEVPESEVISYFERRDQKW